MITIHTKTKMDGDQMTVFKFVFIAILIILVCMLFFLFGFTVVGQAAIITGIGLVSLLIIESSIFKIEEYPVATISTFLCVMLAVKVPIKIFNCLDKHEISIIAIIEILLIAVLLTVNYKDFDKEISKRVHVETDEQHTTVESSDWV